MSGKKHRSRFRKSRKGKGFTGVPRYAKSAEVTASQDSEIAQSSSVTSHVQLAELGDVSDSER